MRGWWKWGGAGLSEVAQCWMEEGRAWMDVADLLSPSSIAGSPLGTVIFPSEDTEGPVREEEPDDKWTHPSSRVPLIGGKRYTCGQQFPRDRS